MSSTAAMTQSPISNSIGQSHHQDGPAYGRNRGGFRGGPRGSYQQNNFKGRGRGRAGKGNRTPESFRSRPLPRPDDNGGGDALDNHIDTIREKDGGEVFEKGKAQEVEAEAEICFICASTVIHNSIAPCNHRTCHICALRLRALYKTRACAHCRTEAPFVIFTDDGTKRYEAFLDLEFQQTDDTLGIKYTQKEIHADTVLLLRYNCPDPDCDVACWGWPDLHRHVKSVHHRIMCDLCTRNKKVFTHEHELFTLQELKKHEKFGDDNPGAVDQSGFRGHPECGFCQQRFYGDDELYTHCREKHERCHICDRRGQGSEQKYYIDYDSLEQHFRSEHFLCPDQECMEKKFVVFESEMDLKAHQLEAHPNGLTKDARKDARRVDISAFDYRTPHQEPRRGRSDREGRGRGRGRDPNTEPLPHSTAQPLRRDELAYQRQMAIQSAQSATARTFGGQLTSTEAYTARPSSRPQETTTAHRSHTSTNPSFPVNDNLNLSSTSTTESSSHTATPVQTPQQQARQIQHNAIINRASTLLNQDPTKVSTFRSAVSSYHNSSLTATELISRFFTLFSVSSGDLGKLIKELADLYENEEKRNSLLKAWNDWRAINEDYPSLPGPSGIIPGTSAAGAGSGGHRVLKLKSSTAQSSRSAVSKQGSWGGVATGPGNPFPAISSTGSIAKVGVITPWAAGAASSGSARVSPAPSRPVSRPPNAESGADAFPALPTTKKPDTLMLGMTRGSVRWDDGRGSNPAANPWGGVNGAGKTSAIPANEAAGNEDSVDGSAAGKRKGKQQGQGKKQTLYRFG